NSIIISDMELLILKYSSNFDDQSLFFFLRHPAPPEIYTLSLHDALPISAGATIVMITHDTGLADQLPRQIRVLDGEVISDRTKRSEEHTSELQSLRHLVCRLLLEKKKKINIP